MLTLSEALARMPGARKVGAVWRAPCPAHGGQDRNLSVFADEQGNARFKCWSRGCGSAEIVAALGGAPTTRAAVEPHAATPLRDDGERGLRAFWLWHECTDPRGTVVQDYLFGRGWSGLMPASLCVGASPGELARAGVGLAIPPSIRFHPRLRHPSGAYLPAMVAAIEDRNGTLVGVHRTFLRPDGAGKAKVEPQKMALGRLKGCAVHLTAGAPELALCEGIETGLSILQATGRHVWCALGTSNLGQIDLPACVRELVIAADNDEPGLKAAHAAADAYRANGYSVRIVSPRTRRADWNDLLTR